MSIVNNLIVFSAPGEGKIEEMLRVACVFKGEAPLLRGNPFGRGANSVIIIKKLNVNNSEYVLSNSK